MHVITYPCWDTTMCLQETEPSTATLLTEKAFRRGLPVSFLLTH